MLEKHLSACLNRAVQACGKNPTLIFSGCPETTQLAWRVLDELGLGLEAAIVQGKALEAGSDRWVDHIWVELPNLGLRIETNPSQILGIPLFFMVMDLSHFAERYRDESERMELLDNVTAEGESFYGNMAGKVAKCVRSRSK